MQQRFHDPVAGRFLSIDPVTTDANTGGSFNHYVYANNNSFAYVDPDGRGVESVTIDKNNNVYIVIGMTYKNISQERAEKLNAAIVSKWSGNTGKYTLHTTVIPGNQAIQLLLLKERVVPRQQTEDQRVRCTLKS
jgi:hypothetical protein